MDVIEIVKTSKKLLLDVAQFRQRVIVTQIEKEVLSEPRIKLLRGLRGTGKTTILLQLCGKFSNSIYFNADNPHVKKTGLYDTVKELILNNFTVLFIDEIHTFPNWRSELKAVYDEFKDAKIIASGSAPLALIPERREKEYTINPLSLGEYVLLFNGIQISSGDEWKDVNQSINLITKNAAVIEPAYRAYVRGNAFPVSLTYSEEDSLNAIYKTLRKSVHEDAPSFTKIDSTKIFAMEKLLLLLASSKLGELNYNSLASHLGISKPTVYQIVNTLVEMKILRLVTPLDKGYALISGDPKLMFHHSSIRSAICSQLKIAADIGAIREELTLFGLECKGWTSHTIKGGKKTPDYIITNGRQLIIIEIGGRNKGQAQLKEFQKKYDTLVILDDQIKTLLL